jgi:hypothetical protein
MKGKTQSEHGTPQHTPPPPFNRTTTQTEGGRQHRTRGTPTRRREGQHHSTRPSMLCHPPPQCRPPIHDSPTHHHDQGRADEGYPITRTAQTDTHPHCTTHPARNSTRHDAVLTAHRGGGVRAGPHTPDSAGQQQHTPTAIPHTTQTRDGHHPLIYSHSFTITQPTNDHDQHDQRSINNQ